jgi:hypothetical protein
MSSATPRLLGLLLRTWVRFFVIAEVVEGGMADDQSGGTTT